jgi:hypothetical protein
MGKNVTGIRTIFGGICFLLFSLQAPQAAALGISLEREEEKPLAVGSVFKVEAVLHNETLTDINAIAVDIAYPRELLALKEWSDGDSIVDFWVKKPENSNGRLSFQGIITGGYREAKGSLLSLYFEPLAEGNPTISILQGSRLLLNDGKGTSVPVDFLPISIPVAASDKMNEPFEFREDIPPEEFQPVVADFEDVYGGNYFLVFSTQDKDSGIDHYEVSEGDSPFVRAESPYLLFNQDLDEEIRVKAIDKAGNETIAIVPARNAKKIDFGGVADKYLVILPLICLAAFLYISKCLRSKWSHKK